MYEINIFIEDVKKRKKRKKKEKKIRRGTMEEAICVIKIGGER